VTQNPCQNLRMALRTCLALLLLSGLASLHREKRQDDDYETEYDEGPTQDPISAQLGLVADSKTIRENIVDEFTCDGRSYGYYADVANDCQLFHICYPVAYPDGQEEMFKWSFICPNQTIFDQANLVCSFPLDAIPCEEAPNFFDGPDSINSRFGEKITDDYSEDY